MVPLADTSMDTKSAGTLHEEHDMAMRNQSSSIAHVLRGLSRRVVLIRRLNPDLIEKVVKVGTRKAERVLPHNPVFRPNGTDQAFFGPLRLLGS
jgi:hypothetical protein